MRKIYDIVGCGKICGVPRYDNGDNQRSWPFGAPQQTRRRARAYWHVPPGETASHTQMTRMFRVAMSFFFEKQFSRIGQHKRRSGEQRKSFERKLNFDWGLIIPIEHESSSHILYFLLPFLEVFGWTEHCNFPRDISNLRQWSGDKW